MAAAEDIGIRRRSSRIALLSAIGLGHLAVIWLLMQPSARTPIEETATLAAFDVVIPPNRTQPTTPPPPPRPPITTRIASASPRSGGSPGSRRQGPVRRTAVVSPPAREALDATLAPLAQSALSLPAAGSALADVGLGGADGNGAGSGSGSGPGKGDGRGAGGSGIDGYARAAWIRLPTQDAYNRYWPSQHHKLDAPVTVLLSCSVHRNGRPYRCSIKAERPDGMGFGRTAIAVLPEARVKPVARNGDAMWDLPVLITLIFESIETVPRITR